MKQLKEKSNIMQKKSIINIELFTRQLRKKSKKQLKRLIKKRLLNIDRLLSILLLKYKMELIVLSNLLKIK